MIYLPLIYELETYDKKRRLVSLLLIKKPFKTRRKYGKLLQKKLG